MSAGITPSSATESSCSRATRSSTSAKDSTARSTRSSTQRASWFRGFIDTHVHSGHRASHRLITDTGRPMYYGQPFLEISVPKEGKVVKGDPRYLKHGDAGSAAAFELNAAFTVAELIRNGVATFVEYGSQLSVQDALLAEVTRLGSRAYLAPGYDCGRWVADASGRLKRVRNDELGR